VAESTSGGDNPPEKRRDLAQGPAEKTNISNNSGVEAQPIRRHQGSSLRPTPSQIRASVLFLGPRRPRHRPVRNTSLGFSSQLHDATCWWQFSSSQGVFADETLSAHLWFWSTAPSNDDGAYPLGNGSKPDPRPQTYRSGAVPRRAGTLRRQTDLLQP
jgi:hypothetical protein